MKTLKRTTAALALIIGASPVLADGFTGATVDLSYNSSEDAGRASTIIGASAAYEFSGFGIQVDLASANLYNNSEQYTGYGLHAYYNVAPGFAVGVFGAKYEFSGDYQHAGLEAKFDYEALSVEVYAGENTGGFDFSSYGVHAAYDVLPQLEVFASYDYYDLNDRSGSSIGAAYEVYPGLSLAASYGNYQFPGSTQDNLGLTVSYDFDGGATFQRREFWTLYPNL